MPYDNNNELPDSITGNLPSHAQTIYRKAFNSAWAEYEDPKERRGHASREETAHRVAWTAVKAVYHKNGSGHWVEKQA